MTLQSIDDTRDVVPRWRSFADARASAELAPLRQASAIASESELAPLRAQYNSSRDLYVIADYLGALIAHQVHQNIIAPVARALEVASDQGTALWTFAREAIGTREDRDATDIEVSSIDAHARLQLRALRRTIRRSPRRATFRIDAALAHATLGNRSSANREARIALDLAPSNRFVVRSAARLLISQDKPDEAAWVLRRSGVHLYDPWILAPLLSAMRLAGRSPSEFRSARELSATGNHSPSDLAELWSEMATIELGAGKTKAARKMFRSSLENPNDNVVAQAEWASEAGGFTLPEATLNVERGYEARSRAFAREARWKESVDEGTAWQRDEPFALEPALGTSYVAALVLEDYVRALEVAVAGLKFHPSDAALRNNAAFAATNLGRLEEADNHLRRAVPANDDERRTIVATRGLIAFRAGDVVAGRALYSEAINEFRKAGNADMSAMATSLWALEESRIQSPAAEVIRAAAVKDAELAKLPEVPVLLDRVEARLVDVATGTSSSATRSG